MSVQVVDAMDDPGLWTALESDGVTPSADFTVAADTADFRLGPDGTSLRFTASAAALDHRVERTLGPLDLSAFDELRLWVRADRAADGTPGHPFFLEVRLASAALDFEAPGNDWARFLPVTEVRRWELVRLSLADLADPVRSAVTGVRIRCADAATPSTTWLDDLLAVRDEMFSDVEAALVAHLDGRLRLGGTPVTATLYHTAATPAPASPAIRLRLKDVQRTAALSFPTVRRDFSPAGFALSPSARAYELLYEAEVFASNRLDHSRVMGFLVQELARGEIAAAGIPLPVRWTAGPAPDPAATEPESLYFAVSVRAEDGPPTPAKTPFGQVQVTVDAP